MSTLIQNNNTITLGDMTASYEALPPGNYSLQYNDRMGYFLTKQEAFKMPSKLYGDFRFVDRWIKSYHNNSDKNLGILLSGIKGTGKTVAAQIFCIKLGYPVIFITSGETGPDFEAFLSNPVFNNTVIFIDEFEKVYDRDSDSNSLLTLMDGMYHTKLIFLLTANDPHRINNRLVNRLNRIKYHRIYDKLEPSVINEVIGDMLKRENWRVSIDTFVNQFDMLTMDILTSVIKEVNLFDEDATECAKYLNLIEEPEQYKISVEYKGTEYPCDSNYVNYKKELIPIDYRNSLEEEDPLNKILPDYSKVLAKNYPYYIESGIIHIPYSDEVMIKLYRNNYSLAF